MPSTFYAFPLFKKGESFLLRTTHSKLPKVVVVDCGYTADPKKGHQSLQQYIMNQAPDIRVIDRLVITHEDADHCEGAGQFIRQWHDAEKTIEEVWLPAHWAVARNSPLKRRFERSHFNREAFEIAEEIVEQLHAIQLEEGPTRFGKAESGNEASQLKTIIMNEYRKLNVFEDFLNEDLSQKHDFQSHEILEKHARQHSSIDPSSGEDIFWENDYPRTGLAINLASRVLDTHKKMAATIAACLYHNVRIRWFDFGAFSEHVNNEASGGDEGFLVPVNSREVRPIWARLSYREVFLALALTVANRESLVFFRPEEDGEPSVLFTADSKLKLRHKAFPKPSGLPGDNRLLATAMHHASATNEQGYKVLQDWLGTQYPPIFVKNGGVGVTKSASSYIAAPDRQCVRCVPDMNGNSLVRVDAISGEWQLPAHPKPCKCEGK